MLKRFWRPETGIFLAIWLVLLVGGRSRLFRDPGTFWHTVVGEQLLTTRHFSDTDRFSYTFAGQPWIPHQWLGECLMALVHSLHGFDSLLLATATLLAALYTWVASRLLRAGLHWALTSVLVMLALGASASHFHIRPHLGTMVGLALTFALLCDFEAGRSGVRRLTWLVPVFLVWTNVHGGMLGGLGTLGLAVGWWIVSKAIGRVTPIATWRQGGVLCGLVLLCGLTAYVNPYGARLPETWLEIMDSPVLPEIIVEHSRLNPLHPDGILVLLFGGVYLVALAGLRRRWPRITWLLPLLWFALAGSRIRHAPLFSLTALLALADVLPQTRWAAWLAQPGRDLFQPRPVTPRRWPDWRPTVLPVLVVALAVLLQAKSEPIPVVGHGWARLDPDYWPVEVLTDLRKEASAPGTRLFNEYLYGGFLIYYLPQAQVFVDDRCELYGDAWLLDFVRSEWQDTDGMLHRLENGRGGFDLALTRTGSGYDAYFRSHKQEWDQVRQTATATLYRRHTAASESTLVRSIATH